MKVSDTILTEAIQKKQMMWYGYVKRMSENRSSMNKLNRPKQIIMEEKLGDRSAATAYKPIHTLSNNLKKCYK